MGRRCEGVSPWFAPRPSSCRTLRRMPASSGMGRLAPALLLAFTSVALAAQSAGQAPPTIDWPAHGGDSGHRQFSTLDQITPANVSQLSVAWTYRTGDARPDGRSQIQCNPIVVHGVLYATSPQLKVFALDAASGRELWVFDPLKGDTDPEASSLGVNRGVVYWEDEADRRILVAVGRRLYALDAATGVPIPGFGTGGSVSLTDGLVPRRQQAVRALEHARRDLQRPAHPRHTGGRGTGSRGARAHPGVRRPHRAGSAGRSTRSRSRVSSATTPGRKTPTRRIGGANAWSGISVDDATRPRLPADRLGRLRFLGRQPPRREPLRQLPAGARGPTPDERVWHFQLVHHDLWDRDPPAAPVLVTVQRDGKEVAAVSHRPSSRASCSSSTARPASRCSRSRSVRCPRPISRAKPRGRRSPSHCRRRRLRRQRLTEADLTNRTPAAHEAVLARLRQVRSNGQFVPPSTQGTVIFPGFDGGAEWGGSAFDPRRRTALRERQRDGVDPHDGATEAGDGSECGGPAGLPDELRGVPWRRSHRRSRADGAHADRHLDEAAAGRGRSDHPAGKGRDADVSGAVGRAAPGRARLPLRSPCQAGAQEGERRRHARELNPLFLHRLQPVLRSGWLPGGSTAVGHAERHRPERRQRLPGACRSATTPNSAVMAARRRARRTTAAPSSRQADCCSSAPRATRSSALSMRNLAASCGRPSCRPAVMPRRRPTRSTAASSSSSPRAAGRWARSLAMLTSHSRCQTGRSAHPQ